MGVLEDSNPCLFPYYCHTQLPDGGASNSQSSAQPSAELTRCWGLSLGNRRRPSQTELHGTGFALARFDRCHGKKIDCCTLLIRQGMFSFNLQALTDSVASMRFCLLACVSMHGPWRKDRCLYEYEECCYKEKWSCSRYSDLLGCPSFTEIETGSKRETEKKFA